MPDEEARIALFIDHENLVIGAREIGRGFDVGPIFDALAERGRVVARRAYADWTLFAGDRRTLVEHNCELIDIPQRTGAVRKNAADIKLAVDAMELAYERGFVSTFVIASGDSDFTPLVAALRALNRRVIGIGVKGSTSSLLPPACDEFLFYDRLPGVEVVQQGGRRANGATAPASRPPRRTSKPRQDDGATPAGQRDLQELQRQLTQTLAGLKQSGAEPVLASSLKRALLRKDPTFSESDYGFRAFRELLAQAERNGTISLTEGQAPGDPAVDFPDTGQADKAFDVLRQTLLDLQGTDGEVPLSGLKDQMRKRDPNWSEKDLGYAGFLQFVKAAAAKGTVNMEWDDAEGDYFLYVPD
jgi:NYN domain-containing protein/OST-HTH/LOTUS domain-containing protein